MSETLEAPRRGRPPRAQTEQILRRRRRDDSLDRLAGSNLGIPPECKDPEYHYHWVNDKRGRLRALTVHDDYDFVTADELMDRAGPNNGFDRDSLTTESDGRVSCVVEESGGREVKAYLLKKPKVFYEHDYEQGIAQRQAMMEARVYEGELVSDAEQSDTLDPEFTYVPKGNTLGDTAPRRRGPIPARIK
jgi:hypothetical protein